MINLLKSTILLDGAFLFYHHAIRLSMFDLWQKLTPSDILLIIL